MDFVDNLFKIVYGKIKIIIILKEKKKSGKEMILLKSWFEIFFWKDEVFIYDIYYKENMI